MTHKQCLDGSCDICGDPDNNKKSKISINQGKVKQGDFVLRKRKSELQDWFLCHPISFAQVVGFVKEDWKSRPGLPYVEDGESWEEIKVVPFAYEMAPTKEKGWIQWSHKEVIIIPPFVYCLLGLLWPLLRWTYRKPLDGRKTDW